MPTPRVITEMRSRTYEAAYKHAPAVGSVIAQLLVVTMILTMLVSGVVIVLFMAGLL